MTNKKIAVVGGGLSGLIISYLLSQKGYQITLYEKEKYLGGELSTIEVGGLWPIEKYYHHLFRGSTNTKRLLTELGIEKSLKYHKSNIAVLKNRKLIAFNSTTDILKLPFLSLLPKIRLGFGSFTTSRINNWQDLQSTTAAEFIQRKMGKNAWDKFWKPLFVLKFGKYADKISAVWFWARLRDRLDERSRGENLGYIDGSFQVLIDALTSKIRSCGVEIKTNTLITKIVQNGKKFEINGDEFYKVICCAPLPVFNEITPKDAIKNTKIKHVAAITVLLELTEKLTDYYWVNVLDVDLPFVVMIEHTNLIDASKYGKHLLYLGRYLDSDDPLYQKNDDEIADIFITALEKQFSNAKEKIKKYHVFRDKFAQPVIEKNYQPPTFENNIQGLYVFSAAHIYPQDRGIENVIKFAQKAVLDISG